MEKENKKIITKGYEDILNPNSKEISDRELLENIYYHLLAIHIKIDKLGMLKYKEMGVEEPENFAEILNDSTADKVFSNYDRIPIISDSISDFKRELLESYFKVTP
ncbi:hypothetical protein [Capnocytophaga cynodegmi]|uniref:Uncharacterized protein n=1 Tax=Capnocytophaga cynodegmi TaxID=28189 RepID=A0A0B7H8T9_9FLAO|nr:hypothetical protein [Capnocytophaga cynodegmi]CEN34964.1 hypothetical protein CCYN2B_240034 [Capnocytophaga cynodegmi]